MSKITAEGMLEKANCLLMEVHSGNVIGGEESQQSYDLQEEISNYLNRKNKLVVGSEWVCDVECYVSPLDVGSLKLIFKNDYIKILAMGERNLFISAYGYRFEIGIDQFLACFSPKEKTNE